MNTGLNFLVVCFVAFSAVLHIFEHDRWNTPWEGLFIQK
jgi:hypothetical protein